MLTLVRERLQGHEFQQPDFSRSIEEFPSLVHVSYAQETVTLTSLPGGYAPPHGPHRRASTCVHMSGPSTWNVEWAEAQASRRKARAD